MAYIAYICIVISSLGMIFLLSPERRQEFFDSLMTDNTEEEPGW